MVVVRVLPITLNHEAELTSIRKFKGVAGAFSTIGLQPGYERRAVGARNVAMTTGFHQDHGQFQAPPSIDDQTPEAEAARAALLLFLSEVVTDRVTHPAASPIATDRPARGQPLLVEAMSVPLESLGERILAEEPRTLAELGVALLLAFQQHSMRL